MNEDLISIFYPRGKEKNVSIEDVDLLKKSLDKKQINATLFAMIIDSLKKDGEICMFKEVGKHDDLIYDLKHMIRKSTGIMVVFDYRVNNTFTQ